MSDTEGAAAARQAILAERLGVGALLFGFVAGVVWSMAAISAVAAPHVDALRALAFGLPPLGFLVVEGSSGIGVLLALSAYRRAGRLGTSTERARIAGRLSFVIFALCGLTFLMASVPTILVWSW